MGLEPTRSRLKGGVLGPLHSGLFGGPLGTRTLLAVSLQGKPGCPARSPNTWELVVTNSFAHC
jgi:hypothetical protein